MHTLYFLAAAILVAPTIYFLVLHIREAGGKSAWPKVAAKVESSGITEQSTSGEDGGGEIEQYQVLYRFTAEGASHQGMLYSDDKKHFAPLLAKYPAGAEIPVFYCPGKPSHNELRDPLGKAGGFPYWAISLICAIGVGTFAAVRSSILG